MQQILGIDIGGVIIDRINDNTDTSFFGDNYLRTTAVPGALETIRRLVMEAEAYRSVHLISKCGERVEQKTCDWLTHHNFFERTGMTQENLHFTRTRDGKAPICKRLGITHFIDDRLKC